jgi:branched-chain amino acid transport system ATP-binding protein
MLRVRGLRVGYSGVEVVHGISFDVEAGSIVALIGSNGAGKTTTLKSISGLNRAIDGSIEFDGARIDRLSPQEIVARGLTQVPEGRRIFPTLTVRENLQLEGYVTSDKTSVGERTERMLDLFPILRDRYEQDGSTLSGGEQQMLALARSLISGPKLLLLDEPSMGLAPKVAEQIAQHIIGLRREGLTVLLVEQNASLALAIADYAYVLETGDIVLDGVADDLLLDGKVRETYLGV